MCGIAGRILPQYGSIGDDLVDLMDAQSHRGADSTGFAIYTTPVQRGGKLRLMGFNRKNLDADLEDFKHILRSHGSDFIETPEVDASSTVHYSVRMLIESPRDVEHWIKEADLISERIEVQSFGKSLEIIKDVGDANAVADKHGLRDMQDRTGLAMLVLRPNLMFRLRPVILSGRGHFQMSQLFITGRLPITLPGAGSWKETAIVL